MKTLVVLLVFALVVLMIQTQSASAQACKGTDCKVCMKNIYAGRRISRCCVQACRQASPLCVYRNNYFKPNVIFRDGCKMCICLNSQIRCRFNCRGVCPVPSVTPALNDTCTNTCSRDPDCSGRMMCCNSGCGRECTKAVGCFLNKRYIKEGQTASKGMHHCVCTDGSFTCELRVARFQKTEG